MPSFSSVSKKWSPRPTRRSKLAQAMAARTIANAFRRKKARKALTKPARKQVSTIAKREIGRQAETLMNFGRLLYQTASTAPNSFEGCRYMLVNVGGSIALNAQTMVPMKTINAQAVNANIAGGQQAYNQTYHGRAIMGKTMSTKVTIVYPSIRTTSVGGAPWQSQPGSYEYRCVFFKTKSQPAINNSLAGYTNAPFSLNGFRNEVGQNFGISSTDADSLPDPTSGSMGQFCRSR